MAIQIAFSVFYGWKPYGRAAKFLEESQWWTKEKIEELQMMRLEKLLNHAYKNVPYYQKRFEEVGLLPKDIQSPADLSRLPVLSKSDIQENLSNMIACNVDIQKLKENHTGGSTGIPLTFYQDANFLAWGNADLLRNYRMTSYELGTRWAFLWGSDYDSRVHKGWFGRVKDQVIFNTIWINSFDLTTETLIEAAKQLHRWNPEILVAYVSSVTLLAKLIKENNIKGILPRAIQTSAEVLTQGDRELIRDVFGCEAFDRYGCREVGNIAHECDAHEGLHILSENNLVGLVNANDQPVGTGEIGRIIVTNLNNFAMPFIRYEIGDMGIGAERICSCGRGLPLLDSVIGRQTDIITSPSGKLLHGEFFTHLFYGLDGIKQFRVVQETRDDLYVFIVPGQDFEKQNAFKLLEDTIHQYGDEAFRIHFEILDKISPAASGKYRFTISKVPVSFD